MSAGLYIEAHLGRENSPEHICRVSKVSAQDLRAEVLSISFARRVHAETSTRVPILEDREAEIADLQSALGRDQDVTRLQIEVEDAQRVYVL